MIVTNQEDFRVRYNFTISGFIHFLNKLYLSATSTFHISQKLTRGISGLPLVQTTALLGAKRGHIQCDEDVDALAYWNDPQGFSDISFESPFAIDEKVSQDI